MRLVEPDFQSLVYSVHQYKQRNMSLSSLPNDILRDILEWTTKQSIDECFLKQTCSRIKWVMVHQMGREPIIDVELMFNQDLSVVANRLPRIMIQSVRQNLQMTCLKSGNINSHGWLRYINKDGTERTVTREEMVAPVQRGHLACLKYILDFCGVSSKTDICEEILYHACAHGHLDIVEYILSRGANIHNIVRSPIQIACVNGHLDVVRLLYTRGCNVRQRDDLVLQLACENGHEEVARYLQSLGADVRANNEAPIKMACLSGHLSVVKFLHSHGADIRTEGDHCFIAACVNGHLAVAKYLHSHGVDVCVQRDTAIISASQHGHLEVVKFLHLAGADIHVDKDTPLGLAAACNHLDVVEYLYTHGSDISADGNYAIKMACSQGRVQIVQFLYDKGADIHVIDDKILKSARYNNVKMIQLIEQLRANNAAPKDDAST
jgi:ankyrin repeat protein